MGYRRRRWFCGGKDAASARKRAYRLSFEVLEDRCLLNAGYALVNLASDVPGRARVTDPNLVNPWGVSFSPTGPFWFADNGTGVSDVLDGRGRQIPIAVTVPPIGGPVGTPTGTVFNGGAGFIVSQNGIAESSLFLFATSDGTISGWAPEADPTEAIVAVDNSASGAVYLGLALATDAAGHNFLYAADYGGRKIDVFDQEFRPVRLPGGFQDATLPSGYAPLNIQNFGNLLYVTYASEDGAGNGFVDEYDIQGSLVRRIASGGTLSMPWGLAIAPQDFGPFGGALLVGNVTDGRISAYNPESGAFLGQLADNAGQPLAIPGLWSLTFGNGHMGGDSDTLFFSAGVDDGQHGLFGAIQSPQKQGADTAGAGTFDPNAPGERADYPLPPNGGPALQTGAWDRSATVAVLLPLRDSSLALVPTLYAVPQSGTPSAAPNFAGPFITASYTRTGAATLVASTAAYIPDDSQALESGARDWQVAREGNPQLAPLIVESRAENLPVSLGAFLDVDALGNFASDTRPSVDTNPIAPATVSSPSADSDAAGEHRLAQPNGISGPPREVPAVAASGPSAGIESTQDHGTWTMFLKSLLGAASLSLVWGCSLMCRGKPSQTSREQATPDLAKTRVLPNA